MAIECIGWFGSPGITLYVNPPLVDTKGRNSETGNGIVMAPVATKTV